MKLSRVAFASFASPVVVAQLLAGSDASAREIAYEAPAEPASSCPAAADVTARIERRAPEGRAARIVVARRGASFHGEVVLGSGPSTKTKALDGRTCGAVVEALSLVVVLDEPADDIGSTAAPETALAEPAPPPTLRADEAETRERDHAPVAAAERDASATPITIGGQLAMTGFASGTALMGGGAFVDVARSPGLGGLGFLQPSARVAFAHSAPASLAIGATTTSFSLTSGSVDVCPIGIGHTRRANVAACGHAELGSLSGSIQNDAASTQSRFWFATGTLVRGRVVLLSQGAVRPVLEIGGGFLSPVTRDRFHFGSLEESVRAPSITWMASAGIGAVMP